MVRTPYVKLTVHPSEEVAVEALVHDRLSVWFMVGRCRYEDGNLQFEVHDMPQVLIALESLNSAKVEGGGALSLIRRIREAMQVPT